MAQGDIKVVQENAGGTYDEIALEVTTRAVEKNLMEVFQRMSGCLLAATDIYPAVISSQLEATTMTDGRLQITTILVENTVTVTGVKFMLQTAGVYTADEVNGVALYSTVADESTKVTGSEITDANFWTTVGVNTKAFTAPIELAAGEYKIAMLWNASGTTTAPIHNLCAYTISHKRLFNNANYVSASMNTQTTLPAVIYAGSVNDNGVVPFIWLYV